MVTGNDYSDDDEADTSPWKSRLTFIGNQAAFFAKKATSNTNEEVDSAIIANAFRQPTRIDLTGRNFPFLGRKNSMPLLPQPQILPAPQKIKKSKVSTRKKQEKFTKMLQTLQKSENIEDLKTFLSKLFSGSEIPENQEIYGQERSILQHIFIQLKSIEDNSILHRRQKLNNEVEKLRGIEMDKNSMRKNGTPFDRPLPLPSPSNNLNKAGSRLSRAFNMANFRKSSNVNPTQFQPQQNVTVDSPTEMLTVVETDVDLGLPFPLKVNCCIEKTVQGMIPVLLDGSLFLLPHFLGFFGLYYGNVRCEVFPLQDVVLVQFNQSYQIGTPSNKSEKHKGAQKKNTMSTLTVGFEKNSTFREYISGKPDLKAPSKISDVQKYVEKLLVTSEGDKRAEFDEKRASARLVTAGVKVQLQSPMQDPKKRYAVEAPDQIGNNDDQEAQEKEEEVQQKKLLMEKRKQDLLEAKKISFLNFTSADDDVLNFVSNLVTQLRLLRVSFETKIDFLNNASKLDSRKSPQPKNDEQATTASSEKSPSRADDQSEKTITIEIPDAADTEQKTIETDLDTKTIESVAEKLPKKQKPKKNLKINTESEDYSDDTSEDDEEEEETDSDEEDNENEEESEEQKARMKQEQELDDQIAEIERQKKEEEQRIEKIKEEKKKAEEEKIKRDEAIRKKEQEQKARKRIEMDRQLDFSRVFDKLFNQILNIPLETLQNSTKFDNFDKFKPKFDEKLVHSFFCCIKFPDLTALNPTSPNQPKLSFFGSGFLSSNFFWFKGVEELDNETGLSTNDSAKLRSMLEKEFFFLFEKKNNSNHENPLEYPSFLQDTQILRQLPKEILDSEAVRPFRPTKCVFPLKGIQNIVFTSGSNKKNKLKNKKTPNETGIEEIIEITLKQGKRYFDFSQFSNSDGDSEESNERAEEQDKLEEKNFLLQIFVTTKEQTLTKKAFNRIGISENVMSMDLDEWDEILSERTTSILGFFRNSFLAFKKLKKIRLKEEQEKKRNKKKFAFLENDEEEEEPEEDSENSSSDSSVSSSSNEDNEESHHHHRLKKRNNEQNGNNLTNSKMQEDTKINMDSLNNAIKDNYFLQPSTNSKSANQIRSQKKSKSIAAKKRKRFFQLPLYEIQFSNTQTSSSFKNVDNALEEAIASVFKEKKNELKEKPEQTSVLNIIKKDSAKKWKTIEKILKEKAEGQVSKRNVLISQFPQIFSNYYYPCDIFQDPYLKPFKGNDNESRFMKLNFAFDAMEKYSRQFSESIYAHIPEPNHAPRPNKKKLVSDNSNNNLLSSSEFNPSTSPNKSMGINDMMMMMNESLNENQNSYSSSPNAQQLSPSLSKSWRRKTIAPMSFSPLNTNLEGSPTRDQQHAKGFFNNFSPFSKKKSNRQRIPTSPGGNGSRPMSPMSPLNPGMSQSMFPPELPPKSPKKPAMGKNVDNESSMIDDSLSNSPPLSSLSTSSSSSTSVSAGPSRSPNPAIVKISKEGEKTFGNSKTKIFDKLIDNYMK